MTPIVEKILISLSRVLLFPNDRPDMHDLVLLFSIFWATKHSQNLENDVETENNPTPSISQHLSNILYELKENKQKMNKEAANCIWNYLIKYSKPTTPHSKSISCLIPHFVNINFSEGASIHGLEIGALLQSSSHKPSPS